MAYWTGYHCMATAHTMTHHPFSAMAVRKLHSDCDGVILPYVAIMLAVIIGLSALALDGSRLMSMQTQLQHDADALALAGAAELDRRPDSIIRAEAAIQDLIKNPISGAGIGQTAEVSSVDFLESLPVSDDLPITSADLTDDPTLAAYVRVTLKPVSMPTIFPVSTGVTKMVVGAQSIAGYDQIVCNMEPLYVCNPFEISGMTYYQATQTLIEADQNSAAQSRLIRLTVNQLQSGGYNAGDMGYLMPATGALPASACGPGGEYGVPQALASTEERTCFRLSKVTLLPGDEQSAMDGLNTRFDIYHNAFSSCQLYPPDQNVRKGFIAPGNVNWCNAIPDTPNWPMASPNAAALPVDADMINGQSLNTNIGVGSGTWNCAAYWSTAHFVGPGKNFPPPGCTAAATISRYDVYRYEMNFLQDRSLGAEFGFPQCVRSGVANRRIITAAIINCGSTPVPMHAQAQGVPVAAFGRFFLVLPALQGTNGNPYGEFLGLVKRSDPSSSDMVQLYR
jgi:Flp pilus assembly protein TadG